MKKYILLIFFTILPVFNSQGLGIEFAPGVKIYISDAEKQFIKDFWNHIENKKFDKALGLETLTSKNPNRFLYGETYLDIARVIKRYRNIDDEVLKEFLLAEKDRVQWEFFVFDDGLAVNDIVAHIDSVVNRLRALKSSKKTGFIKDEIMYRLGLTYYTYGSFGLNRFREATELFYNIIKDYPESDLLVDAEFGIIMTQINKEYAHGRVSASIEFRKEILKDFIKQNSSSNKVIKARHQLAIEYYFSRNHADAIGQYKKIIDSSTRNNVLVLEALKDLIELCKGNRTYRCNHKKYIKIMQDRFPDTDYSKWASGML